MSDAPLTQPPGDHTAAQRYAPLGQHFTPAPVADFLLGWATADWPTAEGPVHVVDPACGDGALLRAASDRFGPTGAVLLGVDIDPALADVAGARLTGQGRAEVIAGDALALAGTPPLEEAGFDLVVMNPPYIGEKGRADLFEETARLGPRWRARTVGRMDYLYYFVHLGLDLLRPGGRLMALTTAYWPSATSASALRADIAARSEVLGWVRFDGEPLFGGAVGQHNLAVLLERAERPTRRRYGWRAVEVTAGAPTVTRLVEGLEPPPDASPFQPFAEPARRAWYAEVESRWLPLGALAWDRQGVVSGCDRVTRRHLTAAGVDGRLTLDAPVFCLTTEEVVARRWHVDEGLMAWLEPLWRGSEVAALDVRTEWPAPDLPGVLWMIYVDRDAGEPPEPLLEHLRPARAILERRREVRQGMIPWYALHWPRDRAQMAGPKLVTARRGASMRFGLDLAGHVVSSDCTTIGLDGGLEDLATLWLTLHLPEVEEAMAVVGKKKGRLFEFYSEPLRRLRLPLRVGEGGLEALDPLRLADLACRVLKTGAADRLRAAGLGRWIDKVAGK